MADMLNDMMLCEELFHTPTGVACADFITEGRRETWPIRSKRFRTWQRCYYQATGGTASAAEIGQRRFSGTKRAPSARVTPHTACVFSQCLAMRSDTVSTPRRIRNALNGDIAAPISRKKRDTGLDDIGDRQERLNRSVHTAPQ
jgi:hypothetical protein